MGKEKSFVNPYVQADQAAPPRAGHPAAWLLLGLLGLLAAGTLVYAVYSIVETTAFLWSARTAEGKVSDAVPHPAPLPWPVREITVTFPGKRGGAARARIVTVLRYEPGETVLVAHPHDRPSRARLNNFWSLHGAACVLLVAGLVASAFAWPACWRRLDWRRHRSPYSPQRIAIPDPYAYRLADEGAPDERRCTLHTETVEVTDNQTGHTRRDRSLEKCPPDLRAELERQDRDVEAMLNGEGRAEITFNDEHGAERTCHTRKEFLREVGTMLDRFTDSEVG